jgi:hypothetical protein
MTWTERRRYFLAAEQRVLAGEPKALVLADLTAAGAEPREAARLLARMVSPQRRRRYRWPQRLFVAVAVTAGLASALSPLTSPAAAALSLVTTVACSALLFAVPLVAVLRWRSVGFMWLTLGAIIALFWTVPAWLEGDALGLGGALGLALCAAVVVAAPSLWRRLYPDLGWAGDLRRSAGGEYLLVD